MDGDIEDGDFGRGGLGRDDVDLARETVEVTVEDVFLSLLNEFLERDPWDFGLFLYDGVISDEEFLLLYIEI